jgi:hypothetical protein
MVCLMVCDGCALSLRITEPSQRQTHFFLGWLCGNFSGRPWLTGPASNVSATGHAVFSKGGVSGGGEGSVF